MTFRRLAGALLLAVVVSGVIGTAQAAQAAGTDVLALTPRTRTIQRYAAAWMTDKRTFTVDEATELATSHDVVAAMNFAFPEHIDEMKAANPGLVLLAYVNGMYTRTTTYPESWYAHDAGGARIQWTPYATWMMSPFEPGWAQEVARLCTAATSKVSGWDGCLLDNVGSTSVSFLGDKSGAPVDPASGLAYDRRTWLAETATVSDTVRHLLPSSVIVGNGVGSGKGYYDTEGSTAGLVGALAGAVSEQFVRAAGQAVDTYKNEIEWKKDVDMLADVDAAGGSIMAMTKVWVTATAAQQDAWHSYALATYLLGTGGRSSFSFIPSTDLEAATARQRYDFVNPGRPLAAYTSTDGLYQRSFRRGVAAVNPTKTAKTLTFSGTMKDLDGDLFTGTVTLPPFTGTVLVQP